jgi:uncharacterized protein (TIGR00106 family)
MPIMEITIIPLAVQSTSLSKYVSDVVKLLEREKNIKYKLTAMGTQVEVHSLDKLFSLAKRMHSEVMNKNKELQRVITSINIDDRRDKKLTLAGKIKSVQRKLKNK